MHRQHHCNGSPSTLTKTCIKTYTLHNSFTTSCHAGHAFAQTTSAGTHASAPTPARAPAPAPAPGPSAYGCYTALNVLEASSQYTTLLSLLDSTDLTSYFDNPNHFITIFAPTNAGIQSTLNGFGTTLAKFANSTAVTNVLEYHLLPSPVLVSCSYLHLEYQASTCMTFSGHDTFCLHLH